MRSLPGLMVQFLMLAPGRGEDDAKPAGDDGANCGDGFSDVLIGSWQAESSGKAFLVLGE